VISIYTLFLYFNFVNYIIVVNVLMIIWKFQNIKEIVENNQIN